MDCIEKIRFALVKMNLNSNNMNTNMNIWNILATNVEIIKGPFESESSHECETAESQAWNCIDTIRLALGKMNLSLNMNMDMNMKLKYSCI